MRDTPRPDFDLDAFMPYLLNQAAEHVSLGFCGHLQGGIWPDAHAMAGHGQSGPLRCDERRRDLPHQPYRENARLAGRGAVGSRKAI